MLGQAAEESGTCTQVGLRLGKWAVKTWKLESLSRQKGVCSQKSVGDQHLRGQQVQHGLGGFGGPKSGPEGKVVYEWRWMGRKMKYTLDTLAHVSVFQGQMLFILWRVSLAFWTLPQQSSIESTKYMWLNHWNSLFLLSTPESYIPRLEF